MKSKPATKQPSLIKSLETVKDALDQAIGAGEFIINICEDDLAAGRSQSMAVRSCPSAALAHCYGATSYLKDARKARELLQELIQ